MVLIVAPGLMRAVVSFWVAVSATAAGRLPSLSVPASARVSVV